MGESNSVFVFRGTTENELQEQMSIAVTSFGGQLDWSARPDAMSAKLLTSHRDNTHAAYIDLKGFEIAKAIGKSLGITWMNLRIQEGSLWDYSLYSGADHADNFSTLPEYWDDDSEWIATQRGNPELLARLWQIEQNTIDRFLRPWGMEQDEEARIFRTRLQGKAYPSDRYGYGDIWQMTDFLRSLGAHDPNFDQPTCVPRGLSFSK